MTSPIDATPAKDHVDEHVDGYLDDLTRILEELRDPMKEAFVDMAEAFEEARRNGHTIYTMGNGGSGAAASHLANDVNKYTITDGAERYDCVSLVDNTPVVLAWANDDDYANVFLEQLKNHLDPGDVVVGISGSGTSENCVRALEYAQEVGATTVSWTGFGGGTMPKHSDVHIEIPSDSMVRCEDTHLVIHHCFVSLLKDALDRAAPSADGA